MAGGPEVPVKRISRPEPEFGTPPESAVWLLYAGLLQGLRWRRHLALARAPEASAVPRRSRGLAHR